MSDRYRDWSDVVIATALIVAGSTALLARLDLSQMPELNSLLRWWPLLLIALGVVLWKVERCSCVANSARNGEINYGK